MMRRGQITVALVVVGILSALVFPWIVGAQEEEFIDCRARACNYEGL